MQALAKRPSTDLGKSPRKASPKPRRQVGVPSSKDIGTSLKVAHLYFGGMKQKEIAEQLQMTPSTVSRCLSRAREFMEFSYTVPGDEYLEAKLIFKYKLVNAVVVESASDDQARSIVGQAAARYFLGNVNDQEGVAFSCGETLLEMVKAIPSQRSLTLKVSQLSIEGDPSAIHQAPATLVGLLRAKLSEASEATGIQLPPSGTVRDDGRFREQLLQSKLMASLQQKVRACRFVFIGVGPIVKGKVDAHSFKAISDSGISTAIDRSIRDLAIVGEINNRLFDSHGRDCTEMIPGLGSYFLSVIDLDQLRLLVKQGAQVVLVATGLNKLEAIRVALETDLANVVITDRMVASRLLD